MRLLAILMECAGAACFVAAAIIIARNQNSGVPSRLTAYDPTTLKRPATDDEADAIVRQAVYEAWFRWWG